MILQYTDYNYLTLFIRFDSTLKLWWVAGNTSDSAPNAANSAPNAASPAPRMVHRMTATSAAVLVHPPPGCATLHLAVATGKPNNKDNRYDVEVMAVHYNPSNGHLVQVQ